MPKMLLVLTLIMTGCGMEPAATPREILVQGEGVVTLEADVAVVRLGVETRARTSEETLRLNSEKTAAVLEALKTLGIAAEAIRTESIQLHPRYEHIRQPNGNSTQTLVGYRASNMVRVQLVDLAKAGDAIDAASQAGANRIDSISFEVSDPSSAMGAAREAAWRSARSQAQQLAGLADSELGEVVSVTTHDSVPGPMLEMSRAAMDSVPISPGRQSVSVRLSVRWRLVAPASP